MNLATVPSVGAVVIVVAIVLVIIIAVLFVAVLIVVVALAVREHLLLSKAMLEDCRQSIEGLRVYYMVWMKCYLFLHR